MPSPWRQEQQCWQHWAAQSCLTSSFSKLKDKHLARTAGASKGNNADLRRIAARFHSHRGDESVPWPLRSNTDIWHQNPHCLPSQKTSAALISHRSQQGSSANTCSSDVALLSRNIVRVSVLPPEAKGVSSWGRPEGKGQHMQETDNSQEWGRTHTRPHWNTHLPPNRCESYSFEIWKDFKQICQKMCHRFLIVFGLCITLTATANTLSGFIL